MATPGKFVTLVAAALGLPVPTVVLYDRYLVEAGLRTKGARGVNAPSVTPRDAAHLITAILGAGEVVSAVATIKRYRATRPARFPARSENFAKCGIKELVRLAADHSFVDGLEGLFAAVVDDSLPESSVIEVSALTPGTLGTIRVAGLKNGVAAMVRYDEPSPWDETKSPSERRIAAWEAKRTAQTEADLEVYRRISARTIFQLGEALKTNDGGQ